MIVGIVMAAPMLGLVYVISRQRGLDFIALQLGAIAAVYAGSSLAGGGFSVVAVEVVGVFAFVAVSLFGRWGSPAILAAGYFGHAAWDVFHDLGAIPTFLPGWYAPFCLAYDCLFGAFIAAFFLRGGGADSR
jgi:hypothetical protein